MPKKKEMAVEAEEAQVLDDGGRPEQPVEVQVQEALERQKVILDAEHLKNADEIAQAYRNGAFQTVEQLLLNRIEELDASIGRFRNTVHLRRGQLKEAEDLLRAAEDNLVAAEARQEEVEDRLKEVRGYLP